MNELCIIGAGYTGTSLIQKLRQLGYNDPITLIDKRQHYFDRKDIFPFLQSKTVRAFKTLEEFAQETNVTFIQDRVERINFNTKKIFLKNSEARAYGHLVIATGAASKDLSIKGDHREGFFYLSDIDPYALRDFLKVSDDVIVFASTVLGLRLVDAFSSLGKNIKCFAADYDFLGEAKERVLAWMKKKNVDVHAGVAIEEVIGEGMIKATRTSIPKVFSSQVVCIDSGFTPALSFLEEKLTIHDTFCTPYPDVNVLGTAADANIADERFFIHTHRNSADQVLCLAYHLLHKEVPVYEARSASSDEIAALLAQFSPSTIASPDPAP